MFNNISLFYPCRYWRCIHGFCVLLSSDALTTVVAVVAVAVDNDGVRDDDADAGNSYVGHDADHHRRH